MFGRSPNFIIAAALAALVFSSESKAGELPPKHVDIEVVDDLNIGNCFYAQLGGGYSAPDNSKVLGVAGSGTLSGTGTIDGGFGCEIYPSIRTELEFGYRFGSDLKGPPGTLNANLETFTGFANVWLEPVSLANGVNPYLGGGVGFASHKLKTALPLGAAGKKLSTGFAWQAGAGLGIDVFPNVTLDLGYRFKSSGRAKSGGPAPYTVKNLYSHEARIGIRLNFDSLM